MTTIITRLFADTATAHHAAEAVCQAGVPSRCVTVIWGVDAMARMQAAHVAEDAAAAYGPRIAKGARLLVAQAAFNPVGSAFGAIVALSRFKTLDVGVRDENRYIRTAPGDRIGKLSVLRTHPRFLSRDMDRGQVRHQRASTAFGLGTLGARTPHSPKTLSADGTFWTSLGLRPLSQGVRKIAILPRQPHMADVILPLISRRG